MEDKIYAIVGEYMDTEGAVRMWKDDTSLDTAINDLFANYPEQWEITMDETFDSPGVTVGTIAIAFLERGELHLINIIWENH